ncbi:MAG: arginine repressor [Defluviitaleaceae bacterium]|nr:arginine repressor [Defluviitaleaceae bacterium]MCL2263066.1 arginine repressor [Defluviitaleaceae bacterium]
MKPERQRVILELLSKTDIYTQEELTAALGAEGFFVAQATVSRDIRELGLIKERTHKGLKYAAPTGADVFVNPFARAFRDGLVSVESAGNMLVLRTYNGMAMAVAAALDEMKFDEILGSVAGDDTVMCVVKSPTAAAELADKLR